MTVSSARHDQWVRVVFFSAIWTLYMWTSGADTHWLDSGELAAAGATLGVSHPPGHPLYTFLAYIASWLPVGTLGFRISLLSGFCGALAALWVLDLILLTRTRGRRPEDVFSAAGIALAFALSSALWMQSIRAEVYTLHLAVVVGVMKALFVWVRSPSPRAVSVPLRVAFVIGLAAGNHHFLLLFFMPVVLGLLWIDREAREMFKCHLGKLLACGLAGLLIYGLLPLRALTGPELNFGDPVTWGRFWAVLTAQAFQASVTEGADFGLNVAHAVDMSLHALGPWVLILALVGTVVLLRRRRWMGAALLAAVVLNLLTKLLMVLDPLNPDAAGYFLTTFACLSILAGAAAMGVSRVWAHAMVGLSLLVTGVWVVPDVAHSDLSDSRSSAAVDTLILRDVLPGSIVMPGHYALHYNRAFHQLIAGMRPDVLNLQQGLNKRIEEGRPFAKSMGTKEPALKEALEAQVKTGQWPMLELKALAEVRPLYVEPVVTPLFAPEALRFSGLYFRVLPRGARWVENRSRQAEAERYLFRHLEDELIQTRDYRRMIRYLWLNLAGMRLKEGAGGAAQAALQVVGPENRYARKLLPLAKALLEAQGRQDRAVKQSLKRKAADVVPRMFQ